MPSLKKSASGTPAVERRVKEIIAEQLGLEDDEISASASFVDDLGADSLDIVELIMALEEDFEMDIPDEDAEKILKVKDAIEYVKKRVQ